MMESPNAFIRAALVSFDMGKYVSVADMRLLSNQDATDGVIGVVNGVLRCHDRLGKIVN